ncbi:MAG: Lrp/AsnC family transcriptional regulator [Bdellovibrionota bacterium]
MKKLQEIDARVLSAVELCAREPLAKIARKCGLRESTVRTTLQRMIDERLIVTRRIYLNPYLLGWTNYAVYLVLAADGAASESPLGSSWQSKSVYRGLQNSVANSISRSASLQSTFLK